MEIGPLKGLREPASTPTPYAPIRDKSQLSERFTLSSENDNAWREQAEQLNQLAHMARLRGYR
ncbi:hypothetical protein JST97_37465 [bacterium]|nr:hypothetical protein [bacterium]